MKLFNITLPKSEVDGIDELYYRANGATLQKNSLKISKGGIVKFDTYFNCFSYAKYLSYTTVSELGVHIELQGRIICRLIVATENGDRVLVENIVEMKNFTEFDFIYDFSDESAVGYYYLELEALSDSSFYGGYYFSNVLENDVKLGLIICTYKREEYVYKNVTALHNGLDNNAVSVIIVDNGQSIDCDRTFDYSVYKNKNCGGSGGFTRGIIEAYKEKCTHFLLMDDDLIFDVEVIHKTINFLKVLKDLKANLCIGGAMISLEHPYRQYEAGAMWCGKWLKAINGGLDLRDRAAIMLNEQMYRPDYNAWWYTCMPISVVEKYGLPLPLFIKGDDIEYGLRCKAEFMLINGIGVWHESFEYKYNGHFEYYIKRNELIINALHNTKFGMFKSYKKLLFAVGKQIAFQRYFLASIVLQAYDDFLLGVDFLVQTDGETKNIELGKSCIKPIDAKELALDGIYVDDKQYRLSLVEKSNHLKQLITLNGSVLRCNCMIKTVDMVKCRAINFYRSKEVLHYNPMTKQGYVTKLNRIKAIQLIFRTVFMLFKMIFKFNSAAKGYRNNIDKINSFEFWNKYLQI